MDIFSNPGSGARKRRAGLGTTALCLATSLAMVLVLAAVDAAVAAWQAPQWWKGSVALSRKHSESERPGTGMAL